MIETHVRIEEDCCMVSLPRKGEQRRTMVMQEEQAFEITPQPGVWLPGIYRYDHWYREHCWCFDSEHFVGLVDGMKIRICLPDAEEEEEEDGR